MSHSKITPPLNVLITRPAPKAQALATLLTLNNISASTFPLYQYEVAKTQDISKQLLTNKSDKFIVFISVAAVEYANELVPACQWQFGQIFAVGTATQQALTKYQFNAITPAQHNSEGLLALPEFQHIQQQNIVIVRGDAGRELLFETLAARGANVQYLQSYQRQWQRVTQKTIDSWRQQEINCIVSTSVSMLENMVNLLIKPNNFWQTSCYWLVASERIANKAKRLGLHHVINAHSADNASIVKALLNMDKQR